MMSPQLFLVIRLCTSRLTVVARLSEQLAVLWAGSGCEGRALCLHGELQNASQYHVVLVTPPKLRYSLACEED